MEDKKVKSTAKKKDENVHKGHRSRVKQGYYERGFQGMADNVILEMLLYFGIPYKDTNEIAHHLLNKFGSFSGVLEANMADLVTVKGMTENAACLITMIRPLYRKYMEDVTCRKPTLTKTEEIVEFLRAKYSGSNTECVYALCFDPNHHLLACRMLNEGDISSSMFDLRKLASLVLETNASSVIISHNHPHGVTLPSKADVDTTELVYELLRSLKVSLTDHIIVSETSYNSMVKMQKFTHIFYGMNPLFPDDKE